MSARRTSRLLACAALALVVADGAQAQMPSPGGRPSGPAGRAAGGLPREERMAGAGFYETVNLRIAQLEEDLNLTAAQLPAWNVYRDRLQRMLDDVRRGARTAASETTATRQLDALADIARNRLAAVEDIVDAGKALYAVLTPEQRAIADRRLVLPLATLTGNDAGTDVRRGPLRPGADGAPPPPK